MDVSALAWLALAAAIVALLTVDLLGFALKDKEISLRQAVIASILWTALGLGFALVVLAFSGPRYAGEYLTGFLLEKSLSVDNLFVFALVFSYFAVPVTYQRRVIFWGIVGAIVLRALFILAGVGLLDAFHGMIYVFGGFLVVTGIRMALHADAEIHPDRNPVLRLLARFLPMTTRYHGDRLSVRENGRRLVTPLAAAVVLVATFDLVFAVDSIPAILAVTRETFLVYAANAFSLLGLASLYFVLAGMLDRFRYLNVGLGIVLVFVGAKMALADVYEIPVWASLAAIVGVLAVAVAVSLARPEPTARPALGEGRS